MAQTIIGLFDTQKEANRVVEDLVSGGFSREDIGLLANNANNRYWNDSDFVDEGGTAPVTPTTVHDAEAGAGLGAIAGLLVGIGAFAVPGLGAVAAAGWLAATLAGTGIGAVTGGIVGSLTHSGVSQEEAESYTEGVRRGGTLITLNSPDNLVDSALDIMHRHGAVDIDQRREDYRQTTLSTPTAALETDLGGDKDVAPHQTTTIP